MGRSRESFSKKEVRKNKEKKRLEKEKKRQARKETEKGSSLEDMFAYVDEYGRITSTPPDPNAKEDIEASEIEISVPKQDPDQQLDPVRQGTLTFYNESKGFGFIKDSETQESIFVHVSNLPEEIHEGDAVRFEVEYGHKGAFAARVSRAT